MFQITCPQCHTSFDPTPVRNGQAECPTCRQRIHVQLPSNLPAASAPTPQRRTGTNGQQAGPSRTTGAGTRPAATVKAPPVAPRGGGVALILGGAVVAGGVLIAGVVLIIVLAGSRRPAPTDTPLAQGDTRSTEREPRTAPATQSQPTQRDTKPGNVPGLPPELGKLVQALKEAGEDREATVRLQALRDLKDLGPAARPAAAELLRVLRNPDEADIVRRTLLSILDRLAPLDAENLPELQELLGGTEWLPGRVFAAEALGKMGPAARPAVPTLLRAAADRQAAVRRGAAAALGQLGPDVRGEAFEPLLRLFDDKEEEVRAAANTSLTNLGRPTASEAQSLNRLLADRKRGKEARLFAVWGLSGMGEAGVPGLADALESDPDAGVKCKAAAALGEQKVKSKEVGKALARAVEHPEREVRLAAATAMGQIGMDVTTLSGLLRALGSEDPACRAAVAKSLPKMTALVKDPPRLRLPPESLEELRPALSSPEPATRAAAAYLIGALGEAGAPAVADLKGAMRDERIEVARREMICALGQIGPAARDAAADLRKVVKDTDAEKVLAARCAALALLRVNDKEDVSKVYPMLARALELKNAANPDPAEKEVHDRAKKVLSEGKAAASTALVWVYQDSFPGSSDDKKEARRAALHVLAAIGPAAKSRELFRMLDQIIKRSENPDQFIRGSENADTPEVVQAAREAVRAIYQPK